MGRKKIRNFESREYYKELFREYFNSHAEELIQYVVERLGFESFTEMRNEERTGMWFDCGWIRVYPLSSEHAREWGLDDPYHCGTSEMTVYPDCYATQSTNIMELMVRKAIEDLGLTGVLGCYAHLD